MTMYVEMYRTASGTHDNSGPGLDDKLKVTYQVGRDGKLFANTKYRPSNIFSERYIFVFNNGEAVPVYDTQVFETGEEIVSTSNEE